MRSDITTLTRWEMARSPSGSLAGPEDLASVSLDWLPFEAPGTAAAALRAAGAWGFEDQIDFDADDWWFRTAFTTDLPGATELRVGGLATICDLWCNAEIVLHSENMYREHHVLVELSSHNEFVLVCRSLAQHLAARRPRGR